MISKIKGKGSGIYIIIGIGRGIRKNSKGIIICIDLSLALSFLLPPSSLPPLLCFYRVLVTTSIAQA